MRRASAADATPLSATAGRSAGSSGARAANSFRATPRAARSARRHQIARAFQINRVERLQQREHAMFGRAIQELRNSRARQHSQDHQDTARTGGASFQYLVAID